MKPILRRRSPALAAERVAQDGAVSRRRGEQSHDELERAWTYRRHSARAADPAGGDRRETSSRAVKATIPKRDVVQVNERVGRTHAALGAPRSLTGG